MFWQYRDFEWELKRYRFLYINVVSKIDILYKRSYISNKFAGYVSLLASFQIIKHKHKVNRNT